MTLRLVVVDDPALQAAASQLRGEWNAQTGAEFRVESISREELAGADRLQADALICPSHHLGPLAERGLLAPIPETFLRPPAGGPPDVFKLLRVGEATWAGRTLAVPCGSPVLVCYYRADLLERLGRQPPQTWSDYQRLAELLADRPVAGDARPTDTRPWSAIAEPLAEGWAALVLLARAAPYAKHRDNYSTLFDIRTMKPLVDGPPFVRALEELVVAARLGPAGQLGHDPSEVRAAFWRGECGMALTWPTAAADLPAEAAQNIEAGFAELPGSSEVYNVRKQSWQQRGEAQDVHVPLVALAGRVGLLPRASTHPRAAARLITWLAGSRFSPRVFAATGATTLFRRTHLAAPHRWTEPPITPSQAAQYAAVAETTLSRGQWVAALRIPGRAEYLSVLDDAVRRAVAGQQSASDALRQAATRWQEITRRLGPDRQRAAYLHSLGRETEGRARQ